MLRSIRSTLVRSMASRHVAGPELDDALRACAWARRRGFRVTIASWGSASISQVSMVDRYAAAITRLGALGIYDSVSIKLDAIGFDRSAFCGLAGLAREARVSLQLDSLAPETVAKTWRILEHALAHNPTLGITLPSRWQRTARDAERARGLGIPVRIVKGQWRDPDGPHVDSRQAFLRIADILAGTSVTIRIATHDVDLATKALHLLAASRTPHELEQLLTLPLNGIRVAQRLGTPFRIYIAYGDPGVPYNVRFAFDRPAIAWWALTDVMCPQRRPWRRGMGSDSGFAYRGIGS